MYDPLHVYKHEADRVYRIRLITKFHRGDKESDKATSYSTWTWSVHQGLTLDCLWSMCHWDYTVITWYTSSWCVQRSPHIAAETNTSLMINICLLKTGEASKTKNKTTLCPDWETVKTSACCSPSLKGTGLHRGLTIRNWCLYCSCTETKGRPRNIINTLHCAKWRRGQKGGFVTL